MDFVNILVLIADSEEKLQEDENIWSEVISKRKMAANTSKTYCIPEYKRDEHLHRGRSIEQFFVSSSWEWQPKTK